MSDIVALPYLSHPMLNSRSLEHYLPIPSWVYCLPVTVMDQSKAIAACHCNSPGVEGVSQLKLS